MIASVITCQSHFAQYGSAIRDLGAALGGCKEFIDLRIVSRNRKLDAILPHAVLEVINGSVIRQEQSAPCSRIAGGSDVEPGRTSSGLIDGMVLSLHKHSWPFPNCPAKLNSSAESFYFSSNAPKTIRGLAVRLWRDIDVG